MASAGRTSRLRKRPDGATDAEFDDAAVSAQPDELPEPIREGRVTDPEAADKALVRKPKIGDTRAPFVPAMPPPGPAVVGKAVTGAGNGSPTAKPAAGNRKRRRGGGRDGPAQAPDDPQREAVVDARPGNAEGGNLVLGEHPAAEDDGVPGVGLQQSCGAQEEQKQPDVSLHGILALE